LRDCYSAHTSETNVESLHAHSMDEVPCRQAQPVRIPGSKTVEAVPAGCFQCADSQREIAKWNLAAHKTKSIPQFRRYSRHGLSQYRNPRERFSCPSGGTTRESRAKYVRSADDRNFHQSVV